MASNAKKKTTFAKLNRENALRERRLLKQAKKQARKEASAAPEPEGAGQATPVSPPETPPSPDA